MKYTIIRYEDPKTHEEYLGLFAKYTHVGKGNCCGWYAAEFVTDAVLVAKYKVQFVNYLDGKWFNSYVLNKNNTECIIFQETFDEATSCTAIWYKFVDADTMGDAIKKFMNLNDYGAMATVIDFEIELINPEVG